ncbi:2-hydroxychromene-2-carboxylate isomerase [Henriciella aquimarina]|uniref:2-hydroxychromene-2-carboxylate isomerase n=1 Tax=Henriciella aquimarina TaxID=545261 RepID=UPI000A025F2F|nr:2-hydroxychromene-2-carboxylate isomerase [Henriciella aquimarina]
MPKTLDFFFDFISPFSYVAFHALPGHLEGVDAGVAYRPMFLGAVMKATDNRPPGLVPVKGVYMSKDLERCCRRHGLGFRMNPHFPLMNTRPLLRAACGLADNPDEQRSFIEAVFRHVWAEPEPLKTDDADQVRGMCEREGFDPARILALSEDADTKAAMKANTDEAVARGAFGAPSFFVGDELFFGHDRLDYAVEALQEA